MVLSKRQELQRVLLAAIAAGAIAVTVGRLTGRGPMVGFAVFLGLQPFAMAWSRGGPIFTRRTGVAAVAGAALGAAIQWAAA